MKKGFTLIELLVVVLIMGILASVAMPQYFKSVEKSRASEAIDVASAVASAEERAYMQKGVYTSSLSELDIGISNLNYFTIEHLGPALTFWMVKLRRNTIAGGGLGSYFIQLEFPIIPGTSEKKWECTPQSAGCRSLLPK